MGLPPDSLSGTSWEVDESESSREQFEAAKAREFWEHEPTNEYYRNFQPQTLLVIDRIARLGAKSVLELGANVGRNIYWIQRSMPDVSVEGLEVNPAHVLEGRWRFSLGDRLQVGDDRFLQSLPDDYVDVTFTVSVLDHIPDVRQCLLHMARVSRLRVLLVELVLPRHGKIIDPRVVGYSYSHNLAALADELGLEVASRCRTPLGEGILEHYETFEILPT